MSKKAFLSNILFGKNKAQIGETKSEKLIKDLFTIPKKNKGNDQRHYIKPDEEGDTQQADLLFLPRDKFGYKYALVVIDIFSNRVDIEPLKIKSAESVAKAFNKIYERGILDIPKFMSVDSGAEFKGSTLTYLTSKKIVVTVSATQRHSQTAFVEYANKLIGKAIGYLQAEKEIETNKTVKGWLDDVKEIVETINDQANKNSLRNKARETEVFKQASKKTLLRNRSANDEVDELINQIKFKKQPNIIKDDIPLAGKNAAKIGILPEGTKVRIALDYPINAVTNEKLHGNFRVGDIRFSKNIHEIVKIILTPNQPVSYLVSQIKNRSFLSNQLLVVSAVY